MAADPTSFDHFRRGEPPGIQGTKVDPTSFDHFRRGESLTGLVAPLSGVQVLGLAGAASAEAFGTPRLGLNLHPAGLGSAEGWGTLQLLQALRASGIPSDAAFGVPVVLLLVRPVRAVLLVTDRGRDALDVSDALSTELGAGDAGQAGLELSER